MTGIPEEDLKKFESIFFPRLYEKRNTVQKLNRRFVHYTSADAAFNIIQNKEFWMRDSSCMNDYKEMSHGIECLVKAWEPKNNNTFLKATLEKCFPGIVQKIIQKFDENSYVVESGTFIGSFSEHKDYEDTFGRLSMWRAYGGENPVALVMNNEAFFGEHEVFNGLFISPVDYETADETKEYLNQIAKNIEYNIEVIKRYPEELLLHFIFYVFIFVVSCTKHRGFMEEREWRAIYCPKLMDSELVGEEYQIISGVPQKICKVPLEDFPKHGVDNLNIASLLDRIIIGPTKNWRIIYKTFLDILERSGIDDSVERVKLSDIPLKT